MATLPTSAYFGVHWSARPRKWVAQLRVDGQSRYIGSFDNEEEAAAAVEAFRDRVELQQRREAEREAERVSASSWELRVVESLCDSKRHGFSFAAAWKIAVRDNPPSRRYECDPAFPNPGLFEAGADHPEASLADSMRLYCEQAWLGEKPMLAHFSLSLLEPSDWSSGAERRGVVRQAA